MGLKPTKVTTNGSAARRSGSWINQFVEFTENLESPLIFRKWVAIATIASALEQKVWLTTTSRLYPNLYTVLVAYPGVGKTRTVMCGRAFLSELEGLRLSPSDMTAASLVDALLSCKRSFTIHYPAPPITEEFHTMNVLMDEWGVLMKEFDGGMVPILTTFYDVVVPFEQHRRVKDTKIIIPRPQLNIIAGATPSTIMRYIPDFAWDQGFTSRLIMVYSHEKNRSDDFAGHDVKLPPDMVHDLRTIFSLVGEFTWDKSWQDAVNEWRDNDQKPEPTHPKLRHYAARRRAHVYKLAIICAVDRGDPFCLTRDHFNIARGWLEEVETTMPDVFNAGGLSLDARIMDEIEEFVAKQDKPVSEHRILRFASDKLPAYSIVTVLKMMVASQRLTRVSDNPTLYRVGES